LQLAIATTRPSSSIATVSSSPGASASGVVYVLELLGSGAVGVAMVRFFGDG
jgi:hypothetical protein